MEIFLTFGFTMKHWILASRVFILKSIVRPMNTSHPLSSAMHCCKCYANNLDFQKHKLVVQSFKF